VRPSNIIKINLKLTSMCVIYKLFEFKFSLQVLFYLDFKMH